ncbi:polysaccharide deacetylase family protein [Microbispora bryophytorum]|uniref:polysaccharide deacetylase family protein n=1 Tax=Microbispora bryophytorum TaxID=1460882 RepID=UPI001157DDD1|nr:polysaccharide deacetylase family protein [Microbispora bryophytorum]TQS01935.1 polysaccharide deacetylase family protein [Microbispora bryophytorum]
MVDSAAPSARRKGLRRTLATALAGVVTAALATVTFSATAAQAADCSSGYVGLTYDDGPNPSNTTNLLNTLRSNGLRATFFNIGQNAQNNPSLVRAQVDAGMWVGNHSWTHPHLTQMSSSQIQSELQRTQQAIQQATGTAPKLFRPPYGETNSTLKSVEQQLGLREIIWDVDSQDWNGASTSQIVQAAGRLQNGQIILMHAQYSTPVQAISQIAATLRSRTLCAGMISPPTGRAVAPDGSGPASPSPTSPQSPSPSPSRSPSPSPSPSFTPPPGTGGCTATIETVNSWTGGFQSNVTVRAGSSAISGWTVTWSWPGSQTISQLWGGLLAGSGSAVSVRNESWNGTLGASASTTFGFLGNGTAATPTLTCSAS